jgi:hypothetical protein
VSTLFCAWAPSLQGPGHLEQLLLGTVAGLLSTRRIEARISMGKDSGNDGDPQVSRDGIPWGCRLKFWTIADAPGAACLPRPFPSSAPHPWESLKSVATMAS